MSVFFRLDISNWRDIYFLSGCEIVEATISFSGNASLQLSVWDVIVC